MRGLIAMLKKILKGGLIGFGAYLGYALVAGNILPQLKKPTPKEDLDIRPSSSFYGEDKRQGPDKAAFFEDQDLLLPLHLDLLNSAEKTIKFANFSIKDGKASDLFYGKLLEAADRGVEVNVLFDGKGHDLFGIRNGKYWALMAHPNIKLAFYEPFRWKRPWTWQNRMHDKYLIIDDRYVLTGGVNLEDAFFVEDHEEAVYDRDVVITNQDPERYDESVLKQYSDYFESVWYHPFTAVRPNHILKRYKKMAEETHEFLLSNLKEAEHTYEERASTSIDWDKHLYPTGKVSLVTNPIQRWKKTR
ncbi:MAG: phospholipase D-like domain-containing protein [Alkalibacterium sp.]|nr:phospholipase D-like domain-containing protein [Alkalibacterium sp.]